MDQSITVEALINAPVQKVWDFYTNPVHIVNWNNASEDWTTTKSQTDLKAGGRFLSRMEAKDGSAGFDFVGTYTQVEVNSLINYTLDDNRKVSVVFTPQDNATKVTVTFDAEKVNAAELQQKGWQAILDNFKKYTEQN